MSIPNYLTFFRIIISPLFLLIYLEHAAFGISSLAMPYILLILLIVSELTDAFDGYIARRYNQVTELGKILDPMADTIVHISVFLTFTIEPVKLPIPIVFLFFYRDFVVSTLRTLCAMKGFTLAARKSGKIKAVSQGIAAITVTALLIPYSLGYMSIETLQTSAFVIIGISALYTVFSGIEYIYANWKYIKTN